MCFGSVPECLKSRFSKLGNFPPMLLGSGTNPIQGKYLNNGCIIILCMCISTGAIANGVAVHGTK